MDTGTYKETHRWTAGQKDNGHEWESRTCYMYVCEMMLYTLQQRTRADTRVVHRIDDSPRAVLRLICVNMEYSSTYC